ncbi:MAG TPA: trigger factor, partial [Candidatus Baltobacteraceae bacterium]
MTPQELAVARERAFRELVKNVRLPGFRPGKVPRKVYEQNYGAHTIEEKAMEDVVPEVYAAAVREHSLEPVARPKMELLPDEEGKPTRVKATVEVRPDITLGNYKGLAVTRPSVEISDDDVESTLTSLARERAVLVPVERAAKLGDVVTMDYTGTIDGVAFEGGSATGQMTELDEARFIPGFAAGIVGTGAGESKNVEAVFPPDYSQADLAGKAAVFAIVVHDVKELELPALDDEFARSISETTTIDELRADVRKRLEAIAHGRSRREVGNQAMEQLLAAHEFALPETMLAREIDRMIEETGEPAAEKTEADLRAEFRGSAAQRVKGTLLIEAIAKAEGIDATPAELQAELAALSRQYGQPIERIREALGSNLYSVIDGIVRNKTLD